jgi:hypothetical protein
MPSDELDPKLEATTRLFTGDLEEFFRRDVLDKARRYSADTADISEMIEALPDEEIRDEQGLLARSRELQALEVLLERVRRATRLRVHQRFCRSANALKDERIRGKVARAFVERVSSLVGQLFASFDVSERAESWTAELERWLVCELERITDKEIIRTESAGSGTTDQKAVDQRTQQIGDRVESVTQWNRSRSQPREVDPRKGLIARIKLQGENKADRIAVLMDKAIEKMPPKAQDAYAPLESWKDFAPEARTWKEFFDHSATHDLVRIYINKVPSLPSEISKKTN